MVADWGFDSDNDEVDETTLMSLGDSDLEEEDDASKVSIPELKEKLHLFSKTKLIFLMSALIDYFQESTSDRDELLNSLARIKFDFIDLEACKNDVEQESCSLKKQIVQKNRYKQAIMTTKFFLAGVILYKSDIPRAIWNLTLTQRESLQPDIFAEVAAAKCSYIRRSSSLKLEAQILTTLKGCPNVVQFFGAALSVDNGIPTYNLFVEYACGGSLHDLIINSKKGMMKMSELEVGFYTYQLLNGILHVHKKGWVHCDIKPANVLVFDNELKLADFGLSLRVGDGMAYKMGRALSNRGTLPYAPPESLTHGFHSKAYDIWSLGCTMAEIMTGHRVWIDCSTKDLQWMIMNEDPMIPTNI
ncbi:hypothetical protein BC332_00716 [Capsicum chinense]|nr:hypothetical protein BC332_00716 [Capsicum chinense]